MSMRYDLKEGEATSRVYTLVYNKIQLEKLFMPINLIYILDQRW